MCVCVCVCVCVLGSGKQEDKENLLEFGDQQSKWVYTIFIHTVYTHMYMYAWHVLCVKTD